ncbi:MAG: hypothetical protein ACP5IL_01990 [Syntrophobacteraceae bacterium]
MGSEPSLYPDMKEGIKAVLVSQFELHEAACRLPEAARRPAQTSAAPVEPVAHAVQDIYKCLHQGAFGVGHIIDNPHNFRDRLIDEIMRAQGVYAEPLLERVSPNGLVFRVNLRPFRALFINHEEAGCDLLLDLCVKSAAVKTGLEDDFLHALEFFRELNNAGELRAGGMAFAFPENIVDGFIREVLHYISTMGFIPVLSHSPTYRSLNHPSYRVVHAKALDRSPLAAWMQAVEATGTRYVH